jgi:NADH:ubiquinone oxidoreductase subunit 2 (subunit N)
VLSLAYYAPLVNVMYRKQPSEAVLHGQALPTAMLVPVLILVAAVVVVGFWPSLLQWLTDPAGAALLSAFGG